MDTTAQTTQPSVSTPPTQPPTAPAAQTPPVAAPPQPASWYDSFKSPEIKSLIADRKFTGPEQLAESYMNLEKLKGVPEERLLRLPEKLEGTDAKAVFEKLGAPKEAKGYELPREGADAQMAEWAESTFFKHNVTKNQAQSLVKEFNDYMKSRTDQVQTEYKNSVMQAEQKLKGDWGANYDKNVNIAKQGAKILGLDEKTINLMERTQGRDNLFKTLHKIGVSVGESTFVDGGNPTAAETSPENAQEQIKQLKSDKTFYQKIKDGDVEATKKWNELHQKAYPGTFSI